jgi:hypothetical protein
LPFIYSNSFEMPEADHAMRATRKNYRTGQLHNGLKSQACKHKRPKRHEPTRQRNHE